MLACARKVEQRQKGWKETFLACVLEISKLRYASYTKKDVDEHTSNVATSSVVHGIHQLHPNTSSGYENSRRSSL